MDKYKNLGLIEKKIEGEVYKFRSLKNREKLSILSRFGEIDSLGVFKPNKNIININFDYILATLVEAPLNVFEKDKPTSKLWKDATEEEKLNILDCLSDELLNKLSVVALDLIGLSEKKSKKSGTCSKEEAVTGKQ